jgi:hypothetical protein
VSSAEDVIANYNAKAVAMRGLYAVLSPEWLLVVEQREDIDAERKALRKARMQLLVRRW